jgi:cytochrome c peroxidase
MRVGKVIVAAAFLWVASLGFVWPTLNYSVNPVVYGAERCDRADSALDRQLCEVLKDNNFTGTIGSQIEARLGRPINQHLADLGQALWFDTVHALHHDNTCGGCHGPANGFGDSQSIAIGVDNNGIVGPHRTGPRNQRRSPLVINTAFYPKMMWNGRFSANAAGVHRLGDPFNNQFGFRFPDPEDDVKFPPHDPIIKILLQAQAFIPPTELVEVGGFNGTCPGGHASAGIDQRLCVFDNGIGEIVPLPEFSGYAAGFRNEPIRQKGLDLLNGNAKYRRLFAAVFPEMGGPGGLIDFTMFGRAIAEFEFTLVFADAPIDQFARGGRDAMTAAEKRGALVFFDEGRGKCVTCHTVKGKSNEMFSDFDNHVAGIPQIAPYFGVGKSNMIYDGPGENEDFGLQQLTGLDADRYKFRTAPLRNLALAPAFFHNGSFTRLEDAIRFHLDAEELAPRYNARAAGVDDDLTKRLGPIKPVLRRLDPVLKAGINLTEGETRDLIAFVKNGLLDKGATKENLCKLVPPTVPSGSPVLDFEECHR